MKKFIFFLGIALLTLSACSEDPRSTQSVSFETVNKAVSGTDISMSNGSFYVTLDYVESRGYFECGNIKLNNGDEISGLRFDVPFTYNKTSGIVVNQASVVAKANEGEISLTDVKALFEGYQNEISFTVKGVRIYAFIKNAGFPFASTNVTTIESGEVYNNKDTQYILKMNGDKNTANLEIINAKFADKMTPIDMTFGDLTLVPTLTGFKATSEKLVPESSGTPNPKYEVTNLSVDYQPNNLLVSFTCAGKYNVTVTGTMQPKKE